MEADRSAKSDDAFGNGRIVPATPPERRVVACPQLGPHPPLPDPAVSAPDVPQSPGMGAAGVCPAPLQSAFGPEVLRSRAIPVPDSDSDRGHRSRSPSECGRRGRSPSERGRRGRSPSERGHRGRPPSERGPRGRSPSERGPRGQLHEASPDPETERLALRERLLRERLEAKADNARRDPKRMGAPQEGLVAKGKPIKRCFKCGDPDHLVKNCPHIAQQAPHSGPLQVTSAAQAKNILDLLHAAAAQVHVHFQEVMQLPLSAIPALVHSLHERQRSLQSQFSQFEEGLQKLQESQHPNLPDLAPYGQTLVRCIRHLGASGLKLSTEHGTPWAARSPIVPPAMWDPLAHPMGLAPATAAPPEVPPAAMSGNAATGHGPHPPPSDPAAAIIALHVRALQSVFPPAEVATACASAWVRDSTQEGIEPNPGPTPPSSDVHHGMTLDHSEDVQSSSIPSPIQMDPTLSSGGVDFQAAAAAHTIRSYGLNLQQVEASNLHPDLSSAPQDSTGRVAPATFPLASSPILLALGCWVRDLTTEGIEPNPGPSPLPSPREPPSDASDMVLEEASAAPPCPNPSPGQVAQQPVDPCDFQVCAAAHTAKSYGLRLEQVGSTQQWFDCRPLGSSQLVRIIEQVTRRPVDFWLLSDGLPNPELPESISTFHVFSHNTLKAELLSGKHSVLFASTPMPFDDAAPVYSLRSWCQLFKQALSHPNPTPTAITVLLVARHTSPSLRLIPLLDKRFELDTIKAWKNGIFVFPDVHLAERNPTSGQVQIRAWPSPYPIMLHSFCSRAKGQVPPIPQIVWSSPAPPEAPETPPESRAHHVLLNAPAFVPAAGDTQRSMSGTRLLMMLNCMDPGESSTQFRHSQSVRYPPTWLPIMQTASLDSIAIANYHAPAHIIEFLIEDTPMLLDLGIRWVTLGMSPGYLINHVPRKNKKSTSRPFKCPSDEILDTLLAPPTISRLFTCTLAFNRWEVYAELQPGVDPQALADTLLSLDNLLLLDATTQVVIQPSATRQSVDPPQLFLVCPPSLLTQYALEQVGLLTSIVSHQLLSRPGHALITLEHAQAAKVLAGCHIPFAGVGSIILTSGDQEKDRRSLLEVGLPENSSLDDRRAVLQSFGRSVLSIENVAAMQVDHSPEPGNVLQEASPPSPG